MIDLIIMFHFFDNLKDILHKNKMQKNNLYYKKMISDLVINIYNK